MLKISIKVEFRRFRHTILSKIQWDSKSPADWVAGLHTAMNGNSLKSGKVAKQGVTQRLWRLHTFVHFMPRSTDLEGKVCGRVKCSGNRLRWGEGKTEETKTREMQLNIHKEAQGTRQCKEALFTACLKTECEPTPLPKFWLLLKYLYIAGMLWVRDNRNKFCALNCTLQKKRENRKKKSQSKENKALE